LIQGDIEMKNKSFERIAETLKEWLESTERKITYSEYIKIFSDTIDKKILEQGQKQKDLHFHGGKVNFFVNKLKGMIDFEVEYYYKSQNGSWIKTTEKGCTRITKFDVKDRDTLDFINRSESEPLEISIDPPCIEND